MKIAVYYDLPHGGAYRTMEELIKRLKKSHELTIFAEPYIPKNTGIRPLIDFYSLVTARFNQKKIASEINRGDYDLVFVSHDRHLQAPWILQYLKKPSVFLCQEPTRSYFEKFLDVDEALPLANKLYEKTNRFFRKIAEIKNATYATKIIANSYYSVESIFRAYGTTSTPVHLGVDTSVYKKIVTKKLNQVTIVGNDEPQKDLRFAIDSLKLIDTKIRPILVIACPRQNDLEKIKTYAKDREVKLKILVGKTPQELAMVYNQSLATLATARLEPFGLSVVESLACGTPVVAVKEGGFRETVKHNINGLLSPRDNYDYAQNIIRIIENTDLRKKLEKNGPVNIRKNFTWEKTIEKIEKIFYEVI